MATANQLKEKLTELKIEFKASATKTELEALVPAEVLAEMKKAEEEEAAKRNAEADAEQSGPEEIDGIEVGDPQLLRPVELPLVVKPKKNGEWANEAQAEFAKTLNAYAYKNPKKWEKKKAVLIKQLASLATDPERLNVLKGEAALGDDAGKLSFKDKRIQS